MVAVTVASAISPQSTCIFLYPSARSTPITCRRSTTMRRATMPSDRIPTTSPMRISTSMVEKNARLARSALSNSDCTESASTPCPNSPRSMLRATVVGSAPSFTSISIEAPSGAPLNGAKVCSVPNIPSSRPNACDPTIVYVTGPSVPVRVNLCPGVPKSVTTR